MCVFGEGYMGGGGGACGCACMYVCVGVGLSGGRDKS